MQETFLQSQVTQEQPPLPSNLLEVTLTSMLMLLVKKTLASSPLLNLQMISLALAHHLLQEIIKLQLHNQVVTSKMTCLMSSTLISSLQLQQHHKIQMRLLMTSSLWLLLRTNSLHNPIPSQQLSLRRSKRNNSSRVTISTC